LRRRPAPPWIPVLTTDTSLPDIVIRQTKPVSELAQQRKAVQ